MRKIRLKKCVQTRVDMGDTNGSRFFRDYTGGATPTCKFKKSNKSFFFLEFFTLIFAPPTYKRRDNALNRLVSSNRATLVRVPGHEAIRGDTTAGILPRRGPRFVRTEPFFRTNKNYIKESLHTAEDRVVSRGRNNARGM